MTISMDKQYRTSHGREVRIYATDAGGEYPIHGAVLVDGIWFPMRWCEHLFSDPDMDFGGVLIEVKPRIQREYWVNLHKDYMIIPYPSKESADEHAMKSRLACVKITIDCEEGEGL